MITLDDLPELTEMTDPQKHLRPLAMRLANQSELTPSEKYDEEDLRIYNDALRELKRVIGE